MVVNSGATEGYEVPAPLVAPFISSECLSNCSALTTNGSTSSSSIPNFFINPYLSYSCPLKTFFLTIIFYLLMTYYQIFDKRNTTGATSGAGTSYPSVAPEFTTIFCGGYVTQSLVDGSKT
jgi:hypothetical protein